jgi:hypothetical protein
MRVLRRQVGLCCYFAVLKGVSAAYGRFLNRPFMFRALFRIITWYILSYKKETLTRYTVFDFFIELRERYLLIFAVVKQHKNVENTK